jgi:hypothetical protein
MLEENNYCVFLTCDQAFFEEKQGPRQISLKWFTANHRNYSFELKKPREFVGSLPCIYAAILAVQTKPLVWKLTSFFILQSGNLERMEFLQS